jgi:hypothetical protein
VVAAAETWNPNGLAGAASSASLPVAYVETGRSVQYVLQWLLQFVLVVQPGMQSAAGEGLLVVQSCVTPVGRVFKIMNLRRCLYCYLQSPRRYREP